jgi:hypothetical protein
VVGIEDTITITWLVVADADYELGLPCTEGTASPNRIKNTAVWIKLKGVYY